IEAINGSQFLTIEMWVRIDSFAAWRTFFCKYQDLGNRIQLQQYKQSGKLAICVNNNADIKNEGNQAYFYTPREEVTIEDWFHLAMVFDGTRPAYQRLKLYINGMDRPLKRDGSVNWVIPTHIPSTKAPLLLGAEKADGSYGYKGLMDEVRIWTVARSENEIRENMENTLRGDEFGLRVYYPMTIASGTPDRLADLSLDKHLVKLVNIDFRTALIERKVTVPLTGASAPEILKISTDAAEIFWTRGSGSANAVFISDQKSTIPHPQSGVTYNANPVYKRGSCIDNCGWHCVYNGHAAQAKISGLFHGTQYQIVIIDYNGIAGLRAVSF
ncbi:MAG TPA: LamG domain-containing protein, partial [Chitinispirillaceae bacterium]|nr:LamG domain-containing protein [Chitinispirillaceae bacterium]